MKMNREQLQDDMRPTEAFAPLIGQLVWAVSQGYDTFVTMEFGSPHLLLREPGTRKAPATPRLQRMAARRMVTIKGDWHLFVEFAEWRASSVNGSISSKDKKRSGWKDVFDDISGQRLLSAESPVAGRLILTFDLGGKIEIWPHPEIDNDVWTLHPWEGSIIACRHDGTIEVGAPRRRR